MRSRALLLLGATLSALVFTAAQAGFVYVSNEGHRYGHQLNANGAVLTSLFPVARFTGTGAATQVITETEILYLGRNCDAFSKVLGNGRWGWANGGFVVEFPGKSISFPRQEIDANNGSNCQL